MILITGATGTVGSEVVTALLPAQASHIRVLTRNPGAGFPGGTQKVVAVPNRSATIEASR